MFDPGRPAADEHLAYFARYIDLVPEGHVVAHLQVQLEPCLKALGALTDAQATHRYAPGKWSVLEVIGHIVDTERVFSFRALQGARGDLSPLPGYDQAAWLHEEDWRDRRMPDVLLEWRAVREATVQLFANLSTVAWSRRANVSEHVLTPRACAYIIAGHVPYHWRVLHEVYRVV
jgi:hypothetical protein